MPKGSLSPTGPLATNTPTVARTPAASIKIESSITNSRGCRKRGCRCSNIAWQTRERAAPRRAVSGNLPCRPAKIAQARMHYQCMLLSVKTEIGEFGFADYRRALRRHRPHVDLLQQHHHHACTNGHKHEGDRISRGVAGDRNVAVGFARDRSDRGGRGHRPAGAAERFKQIHAQHPAGDDVARHQRREGRHEREGQRPRALR